MFAFQQRIFASYKNNNAMEIIIAAPYSTPSELGLRNANVVPTSISPTLYGLLYSVVMFLQHRTNDTGTQNPIDQGVVMYSP